MKRLLLPLLIAISGCSNNLSYKTFDGRKILIREDTVEINKLTRDDFKKKYQKFFIDKSKSLESEITLINDRVNWKKNEIKEAEETYKFYQYLDSYKKSLAMYKNELVKARDDFNKWQKINLSLIGSLKKDLQGTPKIHANNISFTAIETDILNRKKILPRYKNYVCFNPELTKRFRTDWESKLGENGDLAPNNICKKFAKF